MQKDIYGILYLIKNIITNQYYIGQTTQKGGFNTRYRLGDGKRNTIERVYNYHKWQKENNRYYNSYLLNSIEKYGADNFYVNTCFDIAFSKGELDIKEDLWINYYNCINNGFNWCGGGSKGKMSEKSKQKLSNSLKGKYKGKNNPNYGNGYKIAGELNCNFNSIKVKCFCCGKEILVQKARLNKNEHCYCSVECHNKKQGELKSGENSPLAKKIVCINDNYKIFNTLVECHEYYNVDCSSISKVCRGKQKTAKGYIYKYYEDYIKLNNCITEESA
ncbi:MAG: hypothetical protein E6845_11100 [Clostridium sp.]|uniref:hypothetical protein n=1 Tax=Clostridium sp. TaxID=1506 RepID=UPI0029023F2D|nr:hypothetical protein [Clostridium sp.]MDU1603504.1 hypothetical protein [Clostridium sp.]